MNNLVSDWIAVDTNVIQHLMDPEKNTCCHIHKLLERFIKDEISLLVDDKQKITSQYSVKLQEYFKNKQERKEFKLLKSFFEYCLVNRKEEVPVNLSDNLMTAINKIVPEHKGADRFFVYVAFKKSRVLVTNDQKDIIDEGNKRGERRKKLLKSTKKYRPSDKQGKKSDILTSKEAYNKL
ncbi:MAG: hypothetical protein OXM55_03485 [Bdellovibrionales bacterium]|nr:hypothetical protein [Bdellovibrionales bacterium]